MRQIFKQLTLPRNGITGVDEIDSDILELDILEHEAKIMQLCYFLSSMRDIIYSSQLCAHRALETNASHI